MLTLRSHLFNVAFYLATIVIMIVALPLLATRRSVLAVARFWGQVGIWLLKVICGTHVVVRGREHCPPGGVIVAAKHQSFLETFALVSLLDDPTFILKRELMFIPLFGWYLGCGGMVPIDRRRGSRALPEMNRRAAEAMTRGHRLIIFPEGTRRPPGAPPAYKFGVAHLYSKLGVPCLPVAVNSGLFWPRRSVLRRPGHIVIEFLPVIPPGLRKDDFLALVEERIETASNALLAEGRAELGPLAPPLPATAPAEPVR